MKKQIKLIITLALLLMSQIGFAQCDAPINLNYNLNANVSTFTWDAVPGAVDYTFELKYNVYSWQNPELTMNTTTNSVTFTGIMQSISLDWRVKANCGANNESLFTESTFSIPCPLPSALYANNITGTSATINWTPDIGYNTNISDFVASYRILNSGNGWTSLGHTFLSTLNINGLIPGVTYEFCVNQTCPYFNSNPSFGQFTTLAPACVTPTNLSTSNVLNTTTTVTWNAVSGVNSYDLRYKPVGTSTWTLVSNISSTTRNLTLLSQNTNYEIQVRSNCSGSYSLYSSSTYFSTPNCVSFGNNASEWIDRFKVGSIIRYSSSESGGYINTGLTTNLTIGSTNNSGSISAGFSGAVRSQYFIVYIDFNKNGNYNDAGEKVVGNTYLNTSGNVNFKFNIPSTAVSGIAGMRVIMAKNGSATINGCLTGFLGETEDYSVNLISGSNRPSTIEDDVKNAIAIFPNPSHGQFTVSFNQENPIQNYQILTLNGSLLESKNIDTDTEFNVDISGQPNGIYVLILFDEEGVKTYHKLQKF